MRAVIALIQKCYLRLLKNTIIVGYSVFFELKIGSELGWFPVIVIH